MRDRLADVLEKADLAIGSCAGIVSDGVLRPLIETVRGVRMRLAYPDAFVVVALAGGTGSGKSSLFNALVGEEIVAVGGVRPTTSHPTAAVADSAGLLFEGYLDHLGIEERHQANIEGLCLVDLPDTDSVELSHRYRVDSILPLVDVVVWVTDPEKYHDARLHHEYLKPLAAYSGQFVFVLNQIDRVSPEQAEDLIADLAKALAADGLDAPAVVATSATPPAGPPTGIDDLLRALDEKRRNARALYGKLMTDLFATTAVLAEATGSPIDFDARAEPVLDRVSDQITADRVDAATTEMVTFVDEVARSIPGPVGEKLERLVADVPQHMQRIAAETMPPTPRRWFGRRSSRPVRDGGQVRSRLNEAVLRPMRAVLAQRALAQASVAELVLEVQSLR
jgi:GTP-binding protein EngB required for normal cell division